MRGPQRARFWRPLGCNRGCRGNPCPSNTSCGAIGGRLWPDQGCCGWFDLWLAARSCFSPMFMHVVATLHPLKRVPLCPLWFKVLLVAVAVAYDLPNHPLSQPVRLLQIVCRRLLPMRNHLSAVLDRFRPREVHTSATGLRIACIGPGR